MACPARPGVGVPPRARVRSRLRSRRPEAPAFWSAFGGVGWGWPHHQCRSGWDRVSEGPRDAPEGGDVCRDRCPGTPAFLSAFGGPASHHRRGRAEADWGTATTPMARRRPPSWRGEVHREILPRGLPGSAIVLITLGRREVIPTQWRARHAPVSGVPRVLRRGSGLSLLPLPRESPTTLTTHDLRLSTYVRI